MLTAALDAARLGARAPLSADLLRAAAPGYCTSQQQAEAPDNWFEQALAYATGKLHGAAAALSPAGAGMGQVAGYTVADYLVQHASRERRYARVPASTWDAILSHVRDPADAARLADSAENAAAVPLRHPAVPSRRRRRRRGRRRAAGRSAGRARRPGRSCAPGPTPATGCRLQLAQLLAERGDLDGLRARADAGDGYAARRLAELLAERGDLDGLRARADAGDRDAAEQLAGLLAERGDLDGAARPRRRRRRVRRQAAGRAAGRARGPGRAQILRARADAGDKYAASGWPSCWPGAATWTGPCRYCAPGPTPATSTPPGGWPICWPSAATWTGLRARADAGDGYAAGRLAGLLAERGDLDGLRARADAGDRYAAGGWPGCWPGAATWTGPQILRARADAGDGDAAGRLAELLAERGDLDGAVQILRARPTPATDDAAIGGWPSCWPSAATWTGSLRARADAGDGDAAWRLAELLAERGDLDGLRARADAGDADAAERLAELLAERGDLDGLRARGRRRRQGRRQRLADCWPSAAAWTGCAPGPTPATGTPPGGWPTCWPSAATWTGCAPGPTPATGTPPQLAGLLTKQGRGEEAERLRRFGLNPDGSIASADGV